VLKLNPAAPSSNEAIQKTQDLRFYGNHFLYVIDIFYIFGIFRRRSLDLGRESWGRVGGLSLQCLLHTTVGRLPGQEPSEQPPPVFPLKGPMWFGSNSILFSPHDKGFPGGSAGEESARNAGDLGSIPRLGRSPGEGKGYSLQYSGLENSMDCIIHGVTKRLDWATFTHHKPIG